MVDSQDTRDYYLHNLRSVVRDKTSLAEKIARLSDIIRGHQGVAHAILYVCDPGGRVFRRHGSTLNPAADAPAVVNQPGDLGFEELIERNTPFDINQLERAAPQMCSEARWNLTSNAWFFPTVVEEQPVILWAVFFDDGYIVTQALIDCLSYLSLTTAGLVKGKRVREEVEHSMAMLGKQSNATDEVLMHISERIRKPVNVIVGYCDMLADTDLSYSEREDFVDKITESARLLIRNTDNILEVSKVMSGAVTLNKEEVAWGKLFKEIAAESSSFVKTDEVALRVVENNQYPDLKITTDAYQLKQVFFNLVENAFKFTQRGEVTLGFDFTPEGDLRAHVADTGVGIAPELRDGLFDYFGRATRRHDLGEESLGVGLALSHRVAQMLGAKLWYESQVGSGTRFFVQFPSALLAKGMSRPAAGDASSDLSHTRILVAEDVKINYLLISKFLASTNARLIWAKNGAEAVELHASEKPDMILMDLQMPVMNGFDAIKAIRKVDAAVPIIIQSAFVMNYEKEEALSIGADDFIAKPINPKELVGKIMRNLRVERQ